MSINANQSQTCAPVNAAEAKKYYIPLPKTEQASTGYIEFYRDYQLTEVSEEVYRAYYQPIWRIWKRAKRNGTCGGEDWRRCLGDCVGCTRCNYANTPLSMDMPIGDSEEMTVADTVEDPSALTDTALIESAALEELLTALQEIDPDGRRIGELLLEGKSRNDISKILHIGTSTFYKRFDRLKAQLRKRLGEFF